MPGDAEKNTPRVTRLDPVNDNLNEASWAKIWSVYISEAETYDKALVESWKGDMDGLLIFAGLFSASLTAFIVESYKTLKPDSGDTTATLLNQISKQLAASASGTTFEVPAPPVFVVPVTSIVCNTLWFMSLGLSLACALIATLTSSKRPDMRPSPVIRARIFSYLYYGLKRFRMHVVVEVVPLLLHMSLVLFFAGLVAFLLPIHPVAMGISAALLGIIVAIYCALIVLPLIHFDSPYRTPLSSGLWHICQLWRSMTFSISAGWSRRRRRRSKRINETMVEGMIRRATQSSEEREHRDIRALTWTMKSLVDGPELEPFIAGLPDVIWGPNGRKTKHEHLIRTLIDDPEVRLGYRLLELMRYSDSGLLAHDVELRCKITCLKALWGISALSEKGRFVHMPLKAFSRQLEDWGRPNSSSGQDLRRELSAFMPAAQASLEWSTLCSLDIAWQGLKFDLSRGYNQRSVSLRIVTITWILEDLHTFCPRLSDTVRQLLLSKAAQQSTLTLPEPLAYASWVKHIRPSLDLYEIISDDARHTILARFLKACIGTLEDEKALYRFRPTLEMLQHNLSPPSMLNEIYVDVLETVVRPGKGDVRRPNLDREVLRVVLSVMLPVTRDVRPSASLDSVDLLISYLAGHTLLPDPALFEILARRTCSLPHLWDAITDYLRAGCPCSNDTEKNSGGYLPSGTCTQE
ncbi:hypothetical protein B0H16DRAFT_1559838 [Mycena metata]|uniref:DUF6535 domain-containing protein n=1 Tax=Mycena metata TaxID=1033252 RepID=A0AAD7IJQ0_9AGAR|nr:hypothetical protein B0H16DRAFT_1559838 [Mycena metata]